VVKKSRINFLLGNEKELMVNQLCGSGQGWCEI